MFLFSFRGKVQSVGSFVLVAKLHIIQLQQTMSLCANELILSCFEVKRSKIQMLNSKRLRHGDITVRGLSLVSLIEYNDRSMLLFCPLKSWEIFLCVYCKCKGTSHHHCFSHLHQYHLIRINDVFHCLIVISHYLKIQASLQTYYLCTLFSPLRLRCLHDSCAGCIMCLTAAVKALGSDTLSDVTDCPTITVLQADLESSIHF